MTWNDIIYSHFVVIFGKLKNKEYKALFNRYKIFCFLYSNFSKTRKTRLVTIIR